MTDAVLMTVTERFYLERVGLLLYPDFSVPAAGWHDRQAKITIHPLSGAAFDANAHFHLSHFRITDPKAPMDRRWRVTVRLPDVIAEQVPIGSTVRAPFDLCVHLLPPSTGGEPQR